MRIYEDILDDIEIEQEHNDINKIANNNDNNDLAKFQYQYALYILFNWDISQDSKIRNECKEDYLKKFQILKQSLYAFSDSFYTEDHFYTRIKEISKAEENVIFQKDENLNYSNYMIGFRIYLNFDGNVYHILKIFFAIFNLFDKKDNLVKLYSIADNEKLNDFPDYLTFLKNNIDQIQIKTKDINFVALVMYYWFVEKYNLLKFENNISEEEKKSIIKKQVNKSFKQFLKRRNLEIST